MKVVGVFGVSGVGKTTLLARVCAERPQWIAVSAGTLIQHHLSVSDRDSLRTMDTEGIRRNQEAIVAGLHGMRLSTRADVLLLDGHVLVDTGAGVVEIPLDVVRRLRLDAIVFLRDSPSVIASRRRGDLRRRRADRAPEQIGEEQNRAQALCASYAEVLGIPFMIVLPTDRDAISQMLSVVDTMLMPRGEP